MKKYIAIVLLCYLGTNCWGQSVESQRDKGVTIGVEQDVLPYVLNGYIATVWLGRDFFRYRLSYAQASSPKFILPENVGSDKVKAFGVSFEYFFKENYQGLWFGPGIGYWTNYIQSQDHIEVKNESVICSFGGGYNISITNWLYCSPWVALHFRVSGNDPISMGDSEYKPSVLTPELSVKLGIKLPAINPKLH